jgi:hypothetical protein
MLRVLLAAAVAIVATSASARSAQLAQTERRPGMLE